MAEAVNPYRELAPRLPGLHGEDVLAELRADLDVCPKGETDHEACFAPFRYCPEKGCGRMERTEPSDESGSDYAGPGHEPEGILPPPNPDPAATTAFEGRQCGCPSRLVHARRCGELPTSYLVNPGDEARRLVAAIADDPEATRQLVNLVTREQQVRDRRKGAHQ